MQRITAMLGAAAALVIGVAAPAGAAPGQGPKPANPAPQVTCVVDDESVPGFRIQTCTNVNPKTNKITTETITEPNPD